MFTRTEWYVIPIFWLPITSYIFLRSLFQFTGPLPDFFDNPSLPLKHLSSIPSESYAKLAACFFLGNLIWTFLEYLLHRFLFHIDEVLPDKPAFLVLHFLMHGIHHYLPMDRYALRSFWLNVSLTIFRLRLVMPPPLFFALQLPFTQLAYVLFPVAVANGIISGAFTFCKLTSIICQLIKLTPRIDVLYDCMHYA